MVVFLQIVNNDRALFNNFELFRTTSKQFLRSLSGRISYTLMNNNRQTQYLIFINRLAVRTRYRCFSLSFDYVGEQL